MANDGAYNPYQYQPPDYMKNIAGWNQEQHNASATGYPPQSQHQANQVQHQQTAPSGYNPQSQQWRQDYSSYPYQRAAGAQAASYQQEKATEPTSSALSHTTPATSTESSSHHPNYSYLQYSSQKPQQLPHSLSTPAALQQAASHGHRQASAGGWMNGRPESVSSVSSQGRPAEARSASQAASYTAPSAASDGHQGGQNAPTGAQSQAYGGSSYQASTHGTYAAQAAEYPTQANASPHQAPIGSSAAQKPSYQAKASYAPSSSAAQAQYSRTSQLQASTATQHRSPKQPMFQLPDQYLGFGPGSALKPQAAQAQYSNAGQAAYPEKSTTPPVPPPAQQRAQSVKRTTQSAANPTPGPPQREAPSPRSSLQQYQQASQQAAQAQYDQRQHGSQQSQMEQQQYQQQYRQQQSQPQTQQRQGQAQPSQEHQQAQQLNHQRQQAPAHQQQLQYQYSASQATPELQQPAPRADQNRVNLLQNRAETPLSSGSSAGNHYQSTIQPEATLPKREIQSPFQMPRYPTPSHFLERATSRQGTIGVQATNSQTAPVSPLLLNRAPSRSEYQPQGPQNNQTSIAPSALHSQTQRTQQSALQQPVSSVSPHLLEKVPSRPMHNPTSSHDLTSVSPHLLQKVSDHPQVVQRTEEIHQTISPQMLQKNPPPQSSPPPVQEPEGPEQTGPEATSGGDTGLNGDNGTGDNEPPNPQANADILQAAPDNSTAQGSEQIPAAAAGPETNEAPDTRPTVAQKAPRETAPQEGVEGGDPPKKKRAPRKRERKPAAPKVKAAPAIPTGAPAIATAASGQSPFSVPNTTFASIGQPQPSHPQNYPSQPLQQHQQLDQQNQQQQQQQHQQGQDIQQTQPSQPAQVQPSQTSENQQANQQPPTAPPSQPSGPNQQTAPTPQKENIEKPSRSSNPAPATTNVAAEQSNPPGEEVIAREMKEMLSKMMQLSKMNPSAFKAVWDSVKADGPAPGEEGHKGEATQQTGATNQAAASGSAPAPVQQQQNPSQPSQQQPSVASRAAVPQQGVNGPATPHQGNQSGQVVIPPHLALSPPIQAVRSAPHPQQLPASQSQYQPPQAQAPASQAQYQPPQAQAPAPQRPAPVQQGAGPPQAPAYPPQQYQPHYVPQPYQQQHQQQQQQQFQPNYSSFAPPMVPYSNSHQQPAAPVAPPRPPPQAPPAPPQPQVIESIWPTDSIRNLARCCCEHVRARNPHGFDQTIMEALFTVCPTFPILADAIQARGYKIERPELALDLIRETRTHTRVTNNQATSSPVQRMPAQSGPHQGTPNQIGQNQSIQNIGFAARPAVQANASPAGQRQQTTWISTSEKIAYGEGGIGNRAFKPSNPPLTQGTNGSGYRKFSDLDATVDPEPVPRSGDRAESAINRLIAESPKSGRTTTVAGFGSRRGSDPSNDVSMSADGDDDLTIVSENYRKPSLVARFDKPGSLMIRFQFQKKRAAFKKIDLNAQRHAIAEQRATRSRVTIEGPIPAEPPSIGKPRGRPFSKQTNSHTSSPTVLRLQNVSIPVNKRPSARRQSTLEAGTTARQESMEGVDVIAISDDSDTEMADGTPQSRSKAARRLSALENMPRRATRRAVAEIVGDEETAKEDFFAVLPDHKYRKKRAKDSSSSTEPAGEAMSPSQSDELKPKRGPGRPSNAARRAIQDQARRQNQQHQTTPSRRESESPTTMNSTTPNGQSTPNAAPVAPMAPMVPAAPSTAPLVPRMGTFAPAASAQVLAPAHQLATHLPTTTTAHSAPHKTSSTLKPHEKLNLATRLSKSKAARRDGYDPQTVVRDILVVLGRHPTLKPLNAHLHDLSERGYVPKDADLSTLDWDAIEARSPLAKATDDITAEIPADSTLFRSEFRGPLIVNAPPSIPQKSLSTAARIMVPTPQAPNVYTKVQQNRSDGSGQGWSKCEEANPVDSESS
ncbi:hypothetical protein BJ508DRAFT_119920 [Ascobolus immersus RN42]|uniref:Uncharacterized protein n=1 Tax=Ascobolus immersus RN42 TaxID=1160509 RepID=A0A3N4IKU2_ASCIM|nr:hypothetical protein BJ508DRAFT_119920 [Ascobolus immersus RN42]